MAIEDLRQLNLFADVRDELLTAERLADLLLHEFRAVVA
jgi:hypothetical protein